MSPSSAELTFQALESRIARLEDERAIERLKQDYAACCDAGYDLDGLCALFAPDARWIANGYGDFIGHDQIRAYFEQLAPTVAQVLHYVTSPRIDVAPDGCTARGRFYLLCLCRSSRPDAPSLIDPVVILGTYDDRFIKIDGRWLFQELRVDVLYTKRLKGSIAPVRPT